MMYIPRALDIMAERGGKKAQKEWESAKEQALKELPPIAVVNTSPHGVDPIGAVAFFLVLVFFFYAMARALSKD